MARVEELEVGESKIKSAHFLHIVLPFICVEAKVSHKEEGKVMLEWTAPVRGVYQ